MQPLGARVVDRQNAEGAVVFAGGPQERVLKIIRQYMKPDQRIFVGVVATIDPHIDTPEEVCERVLEASRYIPFDQLGTTDDCGFSPFSDDTSTTRETAFAKIRARVLGTQMAERLITGT